MDTMTIEAAKAAGQVGQQLALDKAERECDGFSDKAKSAILARLATGPASGEDLTDYVKACGITFKDGRALGPIYKALKHDGLIRIVGSCLRRNGHGTSGGHVWERC